MKVSFLLIFVFLFCLTNSSIAQDAAADTAILRTLRQYPGKNSLPVRKPVITIRPVELEVTPLDLEVNYWRNWTNFGINLNQSTFSNNWNSGGVSSIALGSNFNHKLDYTKEGKNYASEIILQYGKLRNKGQIERKTNDRIFYDNKVGLKLSKNWYFFASVNFESQFDRGYSYIKKNGEEDRILISRFMTPGYLTESLGAEYKPSKNFSLRIGTGTARQTFVLDTTIHRTNKKNFGVEPGKRFRNELAFQAVANVDKDVMSNVNLKSRYSLFANYEDLGHIDHRLDVTFTARVNRVINVALSGVALYDADTDAKIQASQGLSLGLSYKFPVK